MMEAFPNDLLLMGKAYQDLFAGRDSDEAEAAGMHMGQTFQLVSDFLTKK